MKHDLYNRAIDTLYDMVEDLFGQFEPRSYRDLELAEDLYDVLQRHKSNPLPPDR